ncbi:MAG: RNA polymerase sigma factor [Planctomycetota bacterium]|jgi:RNA polymerase sigma-70 factor (ECF subfamily)
MEAKKPREVAIPELVRRHGGQLYGLGLRLCGGPEEAEDLVQETFLNAYKGWDRFEGRSEPSTWLFTIASRVCQRLHRKRAGEPDRMASVDEMLPFDGAELGVVEDGTALLIKKEAIEQVEHAITTLPMDFRMPLVLKDIVGLPIADVAAILGLKGATVKTRVHRARLKLRQAIEETLPKKELPPAAYPQQVCMDLLRAKQEAIDRGAEMPSDVVCKRCQAVFATLDLTHEYCEEIGRGKLPEKLMEELLEKTSRPAR